ncbi:hypothetical protein [Aurantiacibacter sp. D1-12]|uniref:hypothetical protein n=1 Tax=Aurantiacibacter sp. D1-12 TaxID=2993658 RepID=UPI00237C6F1A|nr:hypothetical protein [Aurantiacibacter sp. D1-12]MDE1466510.1 hypothetical protein [Aurantiacibacter sp. D1-12]
MRRTVAFLALIGAHAFCSGCTVVRVEGAQATTSVGFGVTELSPQTDADVIAYRLTGFGLVPGLDSTTLGYRSEEVVIVLDQSACSVVIFEATDEQIELLEEAFGESSGKSSICYLGGEE